jgi:hypothetical protein
MVFFSSKPDINLGIVSFNSHIKYPKVIGLKKLPQTLIQQKQ